MRKKLIFYLLGKDWQYKNKTETDYVTVLDERIVEKVMHVTVLDERIVEKVMHKFELSKDQVTSIISYIWFFGDEAHHEYFHEQQFFRSRVPKSSSRRFISKLETSISSGSSNSVYEKSCYDYPHDTQGALLVEEKELLEEKELSGSRSSSVGSIIFESEEPSLESTGECTRGVGRLD